MDVKLKEFMKLLSMYRLNLSSFSIPPFLSWRGFPQYQGALQLSLGGSPCWEGLLVAEHLWAALGACWADGQGRKPLSQDLTSFHWSLVWFSTSYLYQVSLWRTQVRSRPCCRHCWSGMTPHWLLEGCTLSPQHQTGMGSLPVLFLALCQDPLAADCVEMGVM